uniref:uncharacterized protein LOC122583156 n=1 Tax=Erigeron canadensis TaxID=72917 RepID=UPI001CB994B4|nr:uncharacterized protein LOC122583156 [Erigeron canadensis]
MQSRLTLVSKLNKILLTPPKYKTIPQSLFSTSSGNVKAEGDDAMTQGVDTEGETANPKLDKNENITPTKEDDHYMRPKTVPPNLSSPKLQNPGVSTPVDPHFQQKRTKSTSPALEISCAGLDGSPWPEDNKDSDRKEQEEDDKEFFKHHKASPLSEIEIGETRKPLERVMQGTADGYFGDEKVLTWKPEQLDTAEQSLLRATQMFREAAARGVPDWPHSRRLRELRGEDW